MSYLNLLKEILDNNVQKELIEMEGLFKFWQTKNLMLVKHFIVNNKMFLRGIIENMFFIRGLTNSNILSDKKLKSEWKYHTSF